LGCNATEKNHFNKSIVSTAYKEKKSAKIADISCKKDNVADQASGNTGQDDSFNQTTMTILMSTAAIRLQVRLTKAAFEAVKATEQKDKIIRFFGDRRIANVLQYPWSVTETVILKHY
jgi:hypothetical protein